jgi:hypothetical protein
MRRLRTIFTAVIIVVFCTTALLWIWDPGRSIYRCKVVIPETNEEIYFRTVTWGISGNHWQVVLSTKRGLGNRASYDKDREYLFYEPDGLLYRVNGKNLEIHVHNYHGSKPQHFPLKANIIIVNHDDNPEWQNILEKSGQLDLKFATNFQ